jgi:hypothetical protein
VRLTERGVRLYAMSLMIRVCAYVSMIISSAVIIVTCCSKYLFKLVCLLPLLKGSTFNVQSVGFVPDIRPAAVAARGLRGER